MEGKVKFSTYIHDKSVMASVIIIAICSFMAFLKGSYFVVILLPASLFFGLLLPSVCKRPEKKFPSFFTIFGSVAEEKQNQEFSRSCSICGIGGCHRQHINKNPNSTPNSHIKFMVPQSIDDALEELLNVVLDQYVYNWYREVSVHDQLADEMRYIIRCVSSSVGTRLCKINLSEVILEKLLPASLCHFDAYIQGRRKNTTNHQTATLQYMKQTGLIHKALRSRQDEADYLRAIVNVLFPYLLPENCQESRLGKLLLSELVGRFLILKAMDLLADPDTVNLLFLLIFSAPGHEPWEEESPEPSRLLLKNFSCLNTHPRKSNCRSELATVLKNQRLLYLFQNFLKQHGGINVLQFYLTVEDFNRQFKPKDLTSDQLSELHEQALGLYHTYIAPWADDKIPLHPDIVSSIKEIVHSESNDTVQKLQTTQPLFQAYEYSYYLLEKEFLPLFFSSSEYFESYCGDRLPPSPQRNFQSGSPGRSRDADASGLHLGKVVKKFGSGLRSFGKHIILHSYVVNGNEELSLVDPAEEAVDLSEFIMEDHKEGLSSLTHSFRDLSVWDVTIPQVESRLENNGKRSFVFLVTITRPDNSGGKVTDVQWVVERRYHEFYILEAKLTEFHGEFGEICLPPRRSLFLSRGIDFMQSRTRIFEEYLQKLLCIPSLKHSQLLFLFLKSKDEFIPNDLLDLSFSRFLRDVPRKLVKEKGQYLEPFISSFISSVHNTNKEGTEPEFSLGGSIESVSDLEDVELITSFYGDNASFLRNTVTEKVSNHLSVQGVSEIVLCIAVKAYGLSKECTSWLQTFVNICGRTIDEAVGLFLKSKLDLALAPSRIVMLIHLIRDVIFQPPPPVTSEESQARRETLLHELTTLVPKWIQRICFKEQAYKEGAESLVGLFQNPLLNKQLSYVLLDLMLEELFPEIRQGTHEHC